MGEGMVTMRILFVNLVKQMSNFSLSNMTKKLKGGNRPPFEKFYGLAFVLFMAYLVGDLSTLFVRQYLLPTTIPQKKMAPAAQGGTRVYSFNDVVNKNIFNSDRKIPPSLGDLAGGGGGPEGAPRLSSLPLDLIGTIVHANPAKSLATVMLRGQSKVEPYSIGQRIENMAEIKDIKRERLIFTNLQKHTLEYIEIPQDAKIIISTEKPFNAGAGAPKKETKTDFSITRVELDKQLENLTSILQQARLVPELSADNQVKGFRFVEIQPGSIFEKLGLQLGDVLKGANGEEVTSPQKGMELFQNLRSANTSEIKLTIERDGKESTLNYTIQ